MGVSSQVLAEFLDAPHEGPPTEVEGIHGAQFATEFELTFIRDDAEFDEITAGAVVVTESFERQDGQTLIRHPKPQIAFLRLTEEFFSSRPDQTTVHPTAHIDDDAAIGNQCRIGPNVYVSANAMLGDRCDVGAGTVVGGDPKGFASVEDHRMLQHEFRGDTRIGDEVTIGSNTVINRGIFGTTEVGDGCIVSDLVHVEHDSTIESRVWLSGNVTVAGNVTIRRGARVHPGTSIAEELTVGEGAVIGMNSSVLDDVQQGATVVGTPASEIQ